MIINLSYLNASNGMFWYAIDKIRTLDSASAVILANDRLAPLVRKELPGISVQEAGKLGASLHIIWRKLWQRSRERVVTFTPHPLPFVADQTVAFYDDFPFVGRTGRIKRLLFTLAAQTSKCRVGIINRSLAVPFLAKCGINGGRIFFDSAFPTTDLRDAHTRSPVAATPIRIGLVGTDSRKKDYAAIFEATSALGRQDDVRFLIYGSENDYTRELRRKFAKIDIAVLSSDDVGLVAYFGQIDYLVSASRAEGYGRPMGLAAALGVPLFLLRSPVFLEFFSEHACFFDNITDMLQHLFNTRPAAVMGKRGEVEAALSRSPFFA